ncbi:6600_t:CDS:1, partial [Gigaspora margarita]
NSNQLNNENDDYYDYFSSTSQSSNVSDSQAIAIAADIIINSNLIGIHNNDIEEDLRDACLELSFLLLDMNFLNSQDLEPNENFDT